MVKRPEQSGRFCDMGGDVFLEEVLEHLFLDEMKNICSNIAEVLNNLIETSNLGIAGKNYKTTFL